MAVTSSANDVPFNGLGGDGSVRVGQSVAHDWHPVYQYGPPVCLG